MEKLYYDEFVSRNRELYDVILKDVEHFKNKNGPPFLKKFRSTGPNFQKYFKEYIETTIPEFEASLNDEGYNKFKIDDAIRQQKDFVFHRYLSVLTFELCFRKVFKISDSLTYHLMNTSLEIDSTFLKLPFEACNFVFRSKEFIESYHKLTGNKYSNENFTISVFVFEVNDKMEFVSKLPENANKSLAFNIYLTKENGHLVDMFTRSLPIQNGKSISNILETEWKMDTFRYKEKDFDFDEGENFFRGLINAILYLNSNEIDILEKLSPHTQLLKKRKMLETKSDKLSKRERGQIQSINQKLDRTSILDFKAVGENLSDIRVKKPNLSDSNSDNRNMVSKTVLVRGHYRSQPFGKSARKRKLIWIKPYLKGSDLGKIIDRNYSVN